MGRRVVLSVTGRAGNDLYRSAEQEGAAMCMSRYINKGEYTHAYSCLPVPKVSGKTQAISKVVPPEKVAVELWAWGRKGV